MRERSSLNLRLWLISIAAIVSLALPAYAGTYSGTALKAKSGARAKTRKAAPRKVSVPDLRSLDLLKEAFQRDSGKLRLLMILSPT
jgi:hypothetical protein